MPENPPIPGMKVLEGTVFPSTKKTISVVDDPIYGGAHQYSVRTCKGFNNGQTEYTPMMTNIGFVKKNDDGSVIPGLQSEQLVLILLDRTQKLNARFPSDHNTKMIEGLRMFLDACQARVEERISRGVMGDLKP